MAQETEFALATEQPTSNQRRLALVVVAVLFAVFAITLTVGLSSPFALIQFRNDAFVLVLAALLFVNDLITAALLFGQFSVVRSRALLIIANAYLFTGLMAVLFALTFPGQFSPGAFLGAGLQTSAWVVGLFLAATLITQFISNTSTALVTMPIAFAAASDMHVSALPMVMSVAMGASASFLTPFANGVSLMVYGPGGYKFGDFWPLGMVVLIWTLIVTVIVTPLYWPFH